MHDHVELYGARSRENQISHDHITKLHTRLQLTDAVKCASQYYLVLFGTTKNTFCCTTMTIHSDDLIWSGTVRGQSLLCKFFLNSVLKISLTQQSLSRSPRSNPFATWLRQKHKELDNKLHEKLFELCHSQHVTVLV
jgi:hypothetical protein